jgi:hypothetical protein
MSIKEWRECARGICAKWGKDQAKSAFVAEYADAHYFRDELNRLWGLNRSLSGKIGALKKRIVQLESKGV